MKVKITITGPSGQQVQQITEVVDKGSLTAAIGAAIDIYRQNYPDAPPFEKTMKVEHG